MRENNLHPYQQHMKYLIEKLFTGEARYDPSDRRLFNHYLRLPESLISRTPGKEKRWLKIIDEL